MLGQDGKRRDAEHSGSGGLLTKSFQPAVAAVAISKFECQGISAMQNVTAQTSGETCASGFTRLELLVVIAAVLLLALLQFPLLATSRDGGHQAVCMNNLRQLGIVLQMYSDENRDLVPDEGNTASPINDGASGNLNLAWYNVGVQRSYTPLVLLYSSQNIPQPENGSIFSCPAGPQPTFTPSFSKAYFMYGMNGRLCINRSTVAGGVPQTKFSTVVKPQATIFMAEVNGNDPTVGSSQSTVTGSFSIGRHQNFGNFTMTDGHVATLRTNDFMRTAAEASLASVEWAAPRKVYWYPTPTTPN